MNKHILMVIDNQLNPDKYTQEQLDKNADDAAAALTAITAYAAAYYAAYDYVDADYWLDTYFKYTGETSKITLTLSTRIINNELNKRKG